MQEAVVDRPSQEAQVTNGGWLGKDGMIELPRRKKGKEIYRT